MDAVEHPLDWWTYGGYTAVMRELKCTKTQARQLVHAKMADYHLGISLYCYFS